MWRMRVWRPSPQEVLHVVHSRQSEKTQGCILGPPQGLVSLRPPSQGFPCSLGGCMTSRERTAWSIAEAHSLQEAQFEKRQSLGFTWHSALVKFPDSICAPSHGFPHLLFDALTVRWRKRSPVQPGPGYHWPQSESSQSMGVQAMQDGMSGHSPHCVSWPLQMRSPRAAFVTL